MSLTTGQQVVCTAHTGSHTGVVAAVLAPGVGYGVAWHARNVTFGREDDNGEPQYPAEFLRGHQGDLVWCDAANVRPV